VYSIYALPFVSSSKEADRRLVGGGKISAADLCRAAFRKERYEQPCIPRLSSCAKSQDDRKSFSEVPKGFPGVRLRLASDNQAALHNTFSFNIILNDIILGEIASSEPPEKPEPVHCN
jgi:hypothetical protein